MGLLTIPRNTIQLNQRSPQEQKRLQSEERRKAQAARVPETVYRVVGNPDRQPVSPRAYAYGPCPDCGAPAGELCRAAWTFSFHNTLSGASSPLPSGLIAHNSGVMNPVEM